MTKRRERVHRSRGCGRMDFSPGVAARLRLADGRGLFVEAVGPTLNAESPAIRRREARIVSALPLTVPSWPLPVDCPRWPSDPRQQHSVEPAVGVEVLIPRRCDD